MSRAADEGGSGASCDHTELWTYYPKLLDNQWFNLVYPELDEMASRYTGSYAGKEYTSGRKLLVVTKSQYYSDHIDEYVNTHSRLFKYSMLPRYTIDDISENLRFLWAEMEKLAYHPVGFDYFLVNIYEHKKDNLSWHCDKESVTGDIISVSLGATRRFKFRPIGWTKGCSHEYLLSDGDVFHMHGRRQLEDGTIIASCQEAYKHSVPPYAAAGNEPRVNLTFRQFTSRNE